MPTARAVAGLNRRAFMSLCSGLGIGGGLSGALWTEARAPGVPPAGGAPVSLSFIGQLFGDASHLAVGEAYQNATGFHLKHPPRFS